MKFVAILICMYFALGFTAGSATKTLWHGGSLSSGPVKYPPSALEQSLPFVLLAVLLGLPVLGYYRAKKQGEFLRFSPRVWIILPPVVVASGFLAALWYS